MGLLQSLCFLAMTRVGSFLTNDPREGAFRDRGSSSSFYLVPWPLSDFMGTIVDELIIVAYTFILIRANTLQHMRTFQLTHRDI